MIIHNYNRFWCSYSIFPCKGGTKIPATPHGFKDAFCGQDAGEFINQGFNIALACEMSNVIVIDIDYHDENSTAEEDLKALEIELNSPLPRTLTQATASGKGKHLIFSNKGITKPKGKIGKYCDVKYSGYIMIAPSVYNGKQYEIIDGVDDNEKPILAELPQAWIDYLNKGNEKEKNVLNSFNTKEFKNKEKKVFNNINIERMFEKCKFLQFCIAYAEELSEPAWFSMISILAQINNSDSLIHELSDPYKGYSYEKTQKKIENARKFGYPHTCDYISSCFSNVCADCKFKPGRKGE